MIADRATILEAEELIATGDIDLVIAEDLSRIYRSARHQYVFVEDCVDAGVRVICVADRLDTAEEDWDRMMSTASLIHSMPVVDARRRQKRRNTYGFHGGGNVQRFRYGYVKLTRDQAASGEHGQVGLRMAKVDEATRIIKKMREILMTKVGDGYSYSPLMDWIRDNNIPVGPYVKSGKWSQRVVRGLLQDPILIGVRRFRVMKFTRIRSTGKFRRELNPDGPETEQYSELAHLSDHEFVTMQEVIEEIAEQHRNRSGSDSRLYRKPRKDALFPHQHATCAGCGELMYAYDSGQMKCQNSHVRGEGQCWNHVQVDTEMARSKMIPWLIDQIDSTPGVRELVVDFTVKELATLREKLNQGCGGRSSTIAQLEREATCIAKAIRAGGELDSFIKEANDIDEQLSKLRELELQSKAGESGLPACHTREEIDHQLDDVLMHIASTSYEFAKLMREFIPHFEIVPVQAIDSGLVRPRARITLSVEQLRHESDDRLVVPDVQVGLNLFKPPKHFRHIQTCLDIKRDDPKLSHPKIADALEKRLALQVKEGEEAETISYMTVKRCFDMARRMEAEGLTEPYRVLTEKPDYASRWKPRNSKKDDTP